MKSLVGSVAALVTPFNDDAEQSVNYDKLAELVALHANSHTAAIVPCGTTGESPTLLDEEWEAVVSVAIAVAKPTHLKVIPGTGSNSTREAVRLTERAAVLGADACLVVTPYYNRPSPEGVLAHFLELDKVGIPLILYNIPSRTGLDLSADLIIELCEQCPSIIGLKASNGDLDQITEVIYRAAQLDRPFSVFSGDDSLTLPILAVGGVGVISVAANIMPCVMDELVASFRRGDLKKSMAIMHAIHGFCRALLKLGPNPAPIKAIMNHAGLKVGSCRKPLLPLSAYKEAMLLHELQLLKTQFAQHGLAYDNLLKLSEH
ncbi:4-hydroxy-tetrahydrodipicolinate synthase [Methylovulum psychrotolerans]|uniref:4-hydroxy-tetrahydrodipicolinate synthase n=1 Tax=Methylovulum psychrotolerans TaxID=1704499 RepID=UPI001BFF67A1|nr:4-hydroxy-tetrahydrodipicolinate synthase [Methylovulum psychrotolerans]MBT9096326.1 4-hydroxy-tetrahydrodipicolinate synthase [Methylovulum psychrotolerans]